MGIRFFLLIVAVYFSLGLAGLSAFDQSHIERLIKDNECPYCDLRDADLRGMMLNHASMQGADLSGANLSNAYLLGADLNQCVMRHANLRGTKFGGAMLMRADLSFAELEGASFYQARLEGAVLLGAKFYNIELEGARLDFATWTHGGICRKGSVGACLDKFRAYPNRWPRLPL